jgi:uncharacterized protein YunC (DUF1805 family)
VEIHTKTYQTKAGPVEGIQVKWRGFNILLAAGSKGFIACPAIDVDACQGYGVAAAIVESSPQNPIGNLDRFVARKILKANQKAAAIGIVPGMEVSEALERIA